MEYYKNSDFAKHFEYINMQNGTMSSLNDFNIKPEAPDQKKKSRILNPLDSSKLFQLHIFAKYFRCKINYHILNKERRNNHWKQIQHSLRKLKC